MALLRAVQAVTDVGPLSVIGAFRAAGLTPGENRISPDEYVSLLAHELLPDIAEEELATVFTLAADHTTLSLEQSWRVLRAAQKHGLRRRLELSATSHPGVIDFADEIGVRAIVLLDAPSDDDMLRMADSQLAAILSVGADGVATWGRACARRLIELGVPLALGTGAGALGGAPSTMLEALRFGCAGLGLSPAEALIATTLNAAFASGLGDDLGPLEPGKQADLLILNTSSYARLPFDASDDPIRAVIKDGWLVVDRGARVA
jgi:imidazolonepropionase